MLYQIGAHNNILCSIGLYLFDGHSYALFHYVEKSLDSLLFTASISEWQADCIIAGILSALKHLEMKAVIHDLLSNDTVLLIVMVI